MKLSLFDWHCDTASELFLRNETLEQTECAVSLQKADLFSSYVQVMAFWTDHTLSDEEGWNRYLQMRDHLRSDPAILAQKALLVTEIAPNRSVPQLLMGVEDARILCGRIERLQQLYTDGVRVLTFLWQGETCIGGSHDTDRGLTAFGKQVVRNAVTLGMLPDISHASVASAREIFEIAQEYTSPVIASHSNAYDICPVSRNLTKEQIRAVLKNGGVIGLNLHQAFLKKNGSACAADCIPHIEHFLSLGCEQALCLGGDWDGCRLPSDLSSLSDLPHLAELLLQKNYSEDLVRDLFFNNAMRFSMQYLRPDPSKHH